MNRHLIRPFNWQVLVGLTLAVLLALPALAQDEDGRRRGKRGRRARSQPTTQASQPTTTSTTTSTSTSTSTTSAESEEEERPAYLAVINGRVHTITDGTLIGATILCKDGVIEAIGGGVRVPDEAEVIDAAGFDVYPGLVACGAGGIHGGGDKRDTTNVFGLNMEIALAGGITTTLSGNDAAKLTYGTTDGLLVRKNVFASLRYSANRPLERARLREDLEKVRDYLRAVQRYTLIKERDEDAEEPDKSEIKGKLDEYLKLLKGERVAIASANEVGDIRALVGLAEQFGFELVIRGATEAWSIAEEPGRAKVSAIVTPRNSTSPDERLNRPSGASIENAAILARHGVPVAVLPASTSITLWGLAGRDLLHLNMEAAFAVRGGMRNDEALRTITIDAARIMRIDDRVGSLEVGKDADLVICDGDILSYMTQVHHTIVNGRVAYAKADSSLYRHIRPAGGPIETDFDDQWPRSLEWSAEDLATTDPAARKKAKEAEKKADEGKEAEKEAAAE